MGWIVGFGSNIVGAENIDQQYQLEGMSSLGRQKHSDSSSKSFSLKSFNTQQDSSLPCIHCKNYKQEAQVQITQLKDKAHQSFMQVLQIQQLHDEELSIMREEFQEKQSQYHLQNEQLRKQLTQIRNQMTLLQKNVKRHSYDFGSKQLVIDNIDAILCQEGQNSYLDQSELIQFKDLVNVRNANDYISSLRREIYKDFKFVSNHKTQIQKLFILIKEIKEENASLAQKNEELARKISLLQNQMKTSKNANQGLNRQIKFITEQIKKLNSEKLQLQKKVTQLQRSKSQQSSNIKSNGFINQLNIKSLSPNQKQEPIQHQSILQISKFNCSQISELRKQVNELNYANFMTQEELGSQHHNFKKRGSHGDGDRIIKH